MSEKYDRVKEHGRKDNPRSTGSRRKEETHKVCVLAIHEFWPVMKVIQVNEPSHKWEE